MGKDRRGLYLFEDEKIRYIRREADSGRKTLTALAHEQDVSVVTIWKIVHHETYKHVK